jgi:hypothetical protein
VRKGEKIKKVFEFSRENDYFHIYIVLKEKRELKKEEV